MNKEQTISKYDREMLDFGKELLKPTKAELKVIKDMEKEMDKWSKLYFPALALTLKRDYGYGSERLSNVFRETMDAFDECAALAEAKSMIQMLDEETGVELRNERGISYRELPYLCNDAWNGVPIYDPNKRIVLRIKQKEWIRQLILAGILLAMNRLYNFGQNRIEKLYLNMERVLREYNYKKSDIIKDCETETGISIVRYYESAIKNKENRKEIF